MWSNFSTIIEKYNIKKKIFVDLYFFPQGNIVPKYFYLKFVTHNLIIFELN